MKRTEKNTYFIGTKKSNATSTRLCEIISPITHNSGKTKLFICKHTRQKGTTLVEITVASFLLFVISGTIALALSTVFDGYILTQQGSGVEQDAQLMLSRLRFASEKHDDSVIFSHFGRENLIAAGSTLSSVVVDQSATNNIYLSESATQGTYTSPLFTLEDKKRLGKTLFVGNVSTTSATLKMQIAAFNKIGGTCENRVETYVGPDKTPTSFYEKTIEEIPESTNSDYTNPAECLRYKVYLQRDSVSVASPRFFGVRFEK